MKILRRLNNDGFSHHFLMPILVIGLIASAGAYLVNQSNADTIYADGPLYVGNRFISPDGTSTENAGYNYNRVAFSPDGKRIAGTNYSQKQDGVGFGTSVYIASSDGTKGARLLSDYDNISVPRWSPDGNYLIFNGIIDRNDSYDQTIYRVAVDGNSEPEPLSAFTEQYPEYNFLRSVGSFALKNDGESFVYVDSPANVREGQDASEGQISYCTGKLNSDEASVCTNLKLPNGISVEIRAPNIVFSEDNNLIYFISSVRGQISNEGTTRSASTLFKLDTKSNKISKVAGSNGKSIVDVLVAPSGKNVLYLQRNADPNDTTGASDITEIYYGEIGSTAFKSVFSAQSSLYPITWQGYLKGQPQPSLPKDNSTTLSCTIDTPASAINGNTDNIVKATITSTSLSTSSVSPRLEMRYSSQPTTTSPDKQPLIATVGPISIPANNSRTFDLPAYMFKYASTPGETVDVNLNNLGENQQLFSCGSSIDSPTGPLSLNSQSTRVLTYARNKAFNIAGTTAPNIPVSARTNTSEKSITSTNASSTGYFNMPLSTLKDITYTVQIPNFESEPVQIVLKPQVNGKLVRSYKKGKEATISGGYTPNTNLTIHIHKDGNKAGKYPQKITVKTDRNGNFSATLNVNQNVTLSTT